MTIAVYSLTIYGYAMTLHSVYIVYIPKTDIVYIYCLYGRNILIRFIYVNMILLLLNIPERQCRKEQGFIKSADPHTAMLDS